MPEAHAYLSGANITTKKKISYQGEEKKQTKKTNAK